MAVYSVLSAEIIGKLFRQTDRRYGIELCIIVIINDNLGLISS